MGLEKELCDILDKLDDCIVELEKERNVLANKKNEMHLNYLRIIQLESEINAYKKAWHVVYNRLNLEI